MLPLHFGERIEIELNAQAQAAAAALRGDLQHKSGLQDYFRDHGDTFRR